MLLEGLFITFLISAAIQIIFYGISIFKISRHKQASHVLDIEDKPVSIIICAHNEFENLRNLLPKLYAQAYTRFEIIIVDDRSNDGSYEFLLEEAANRKALKLVRVDFTPDHINAKKYAITLGIKAASNDMVLLTDADCEPASTNWIHSMMNQFVPETEFLLGFSYYLKKKGFLNSFIRHETIQTALQYVTFAKSGMPYMGVGRNLGYRKSSFLERKGFGDFKSIVGGDDDLLVNRYANKHNTSVVLSPESVIMSEPKTSFKDYQIQKKRHLSVGKKYKLKHKVILGLLVLSKFIFWAGGLALLILPYQLNITIGIFIIQLLILFWSFKSFTKKTGVKYHVGWVWLMDIVYISYLISFGTTALRSRNIKWR